MRYILEVVMRLFSGSYEAVIRLEISAAERFGDVRAGCEKHTLLITMILTLLETTLEFVTTSRRFLLRLRILRSSF